MVKQREWQEQARNAPKAVDQLNDAVRKRKRFCTAFT